MIVAFCIINLLVLANSIEHHPKIGYDSGSDLTYIQILSNRLPASTEDTEFFTPPLPFFAPSLFNDVCNVVVPGPTTELYGLNVKWDCRFYDGKFAQFLNFLLSIGTVLLLLFISDKIKPGNRYFKLSVLAFLSVLTVYYKTFSQVRPEPYLVFFAALSTYLLILNLEDPVLVRRHVVLLGVSLGLLMLSRQWGIFVYVAIGLLMIWLFFQDREQASHLFRPVLFSFLISVLIGGWFYLHLYLSEGSFTAFNIKAPGFSLSNLPPGFFRETELRGGQLFRAPVRPNFDGQFFPMLYSDVWGDYWGYFTFYKRGLGLVDTSGQTVPFLGQVNLFAVIPSILLLAGAILGVIRLFRRTVPLTGEATWLAFFSLMAISSMVGFLWFIISYYSVSTATLKATYVLQLFIALLFPAAALLEKLRERSRLLYWVAISLLLIVLIHDWPAMITNYKDFLL